MAFLVGLFAFGAALVLLGLGCLHETGRDLDAIIADELGPGGDQ